jgi:post-segregation antitoxin (ccd killing protein)
MPKVSVYLSDELYRAARERGLSVSSVTQRALEAALRGDANRDWIERARKRPTRPAVDMEALMAEVREDFGR